MHFGVLGPVVVSGPAGVVDVGGPRQRRLLAALIANVNHVVSTDRLIDIVFEGDPPDGATTTIRTYVARVRRALGQVDAGPLATEAPGYVLRLPPEDLDVTQFASLLETGQRQLAERDAVGAVATLREALGLWRGPAYDEFTYEEWARAEVVRLEERRTVAEEELIEAQLACGLAEEVVAELRRLVDQHPLRDRLRGQLVVALYRAGRQAEALRSFEEYRQALIEVGLEPSTELLALEQSVAVHDPSLQLSAPAGRPLRGYRLGARLGAGRHGVVYRGIQPGVGRDVAVKGIRPELSDDPTFIRRFDAEAQVVSRLEHPHIVPLYDFWREPGAAYMVMRLLAGSLEERLATGPLDPQASARLIDQIGSALSAAHRAGVIHGDLKPSNVLLDGDGNAYLSDFGMATLAGHRAGDPPEPSSGYESPEQLAGEEATPASDQFALAVLMVQTLTGALPFGMRAIASPHDRIPSMHVQRPSVPAAVDDVVWRATEWSAEDRYPSVAEFVAAVQKGFGAPIDWTPLRAAEASNPYKGLRAFGETDWQDFFGRDQVVEELLARLGGGGGSRFVTVIGASGSGKSSVVRAGLVPRLRAGALAGSDRWFVTTMVPGSQPFAELEVALRSIAVDVQADEGAEGDLVTGILQAAVPTGQEVLLVIDQLEELFTVVTEERVRRAFLDGLTKAVSAPGSSLRVVATLRADFFDRPLRYHGFGNLMREGAVALVGMSAPDVARAIQEPAARRGIEVEPALATRLVAEVMDQPSALPLLQYTMTELFEQRTGRVIEHGTYERMGGVEAAVARRADQVLATIPAAGHGLVRRLFLRLVTIDENGTVTRRRTRRSEMVSLARGVADAEKILDDFGDARLLTFDRDPTTREPTVEVAHEAMIHHWPRLSAWVEDAGDGLRIRAHLTEAATAWDRQGRDAGEFYRGTRLETASSWAADNPGVLNPLEQEFLESSRALAEAEREAERARVRRLKGLLSGVGITLVVALIAGFVALGQRNQARLQRQIATVRELVSASTAHLEIDPTLSLLLAVEAVDVMKEAGTYLPEAEQALHDALLADRLLWSVPNHANGLAHLSPDGGRMIALTHPDDDTIPQIWDVRTLEPIVDLVGHERSVLDGVFSPDGGRIATTSLDGTVRVWDATTGEALSILPMVIESCVADENPSCGPVIPTFSHGGTKVAASSFPGDVWIWDLAGDDVVRLSPERPEFDVGFNLEFSPDDSILAVSYETDVVGLWNTDTGELSGTLDHEGVVVDVGFTPDGSRLVAGGDQITIWDLQSGDVVGTLTDHTGAARDLDVASDGRLVASGGAADVLVWDLDTLEVVYRVTGHGGDVDGIDIDVDRGLLMTGSWVDQTTRLWDVSPFWSHELVSLPGPDGAPGAVSFAPDGRSLVASRGENLVTKWDHASAEEVATVRGPEHWMTRITHSAEGRFVAATGYGGLTVWEDVREEVAALLSGLETRGVAFSPTESTLATASDTGVELWSLPSGTHRVVTDEFAYAVAFSPDGSLLALSRTDEFDIGIYVEVIRIDTGEVVGALDVALPDGEHTQPVIDLEFSPDGDRLVTVGVDAVGVVWDTASWEPLRRLEGHDSVILSMDHDPVRAEVATASLDGTVKVWNTETGAVRLSFAGPAPFTGVDYSPDGRYLAIVGEGLPVQVLMLDLDELVAEARSRLARTWTEAECLQYLHTAECPPDPRSVPAEA